MVEVAFRRMDLGASVRKAAIAAGRLVRPAVATAVVALGLSMPVEGLAAVPGATPSIRGAAEVGQNLQAVVEESPPGRWQWLRCRPDGDPGIPSLEVIGRECTAIPGAGSALYVVRGADVGHRIRVLARYADSTTASAPTAVVGAATARSTAPPALTSTAAPAVGTTVTWTVGRWTNTTTLDVIVQRCAPDGSACQDVDATTVTYADGQTASYVVRAADAGQVLVLAAQAHGDVASRVRSAPTPVVTGAAPPPAPPVPPPPPPPVVPERPTAPGVVASLRARLDVNVVRLTWRAPTGQAVVVVRRVGRRPLRPDDGTVVYRGRARSALDTPRSARRVWYAVFLRSRVTAAGAATARPAYASLPRVTPRLLAPLQGARTGRTVRFAWRAVKGARYYNVQIWNRRVTRRIATRWPLARAMTLRLAPGSYRWYVYPGFGARTSVRYGKLVGQGSFTVR